jgi:hypothetical protein
MGRACSTHRREAEYLRGSGGKTRREEPTRKTQTKSEDNIKMYLREIGWGVVD